MKLCNWHGVGNDSVYNPTVVFQTFPFPDGISPAIPAADIEDDPRAVAIAEAARRLVALRDRWLNPPEWVEWADEPVPGYPRRLVARDDAAAKALKARTLTALYNARPQWLADAHAALNAAGAVAYGWDAGVSEDEALRNLLALNCGEREAKRSSREERMRPLPEGAASYARTATFSARSIPENLRTSHRAKAGTWAKSSSWRADCAIAS